jgi:membrane protein required for colicin V production
MTAFDLVVIVIVAVSVIFGLIRGAVREVLSLASWIIAFLVAKTFSVPMADVLTRLVGNPTLRLIAGFVIVFVLALVAMAIVGLLMSAAIKKLGLGPVDRTLGILVGAARGIVIMLILVLLGGMTALPTQPDWRNALTSRWFETLALGVKPWLPDALAKRIQFGSAKT